MQNNCYTRHRVMIIGVTDANTDKKTIACQLMKLMHACIMQQTNRQALLQ